MSVKIKNLKIVGGNEENFYTLLDIDCDQRLHSFSLVGNLVSDLVPFTKTNILRFIALFPSLQLNHKIKYVEHIPCQNSRRVYQTIILYLA